MAEPQQPDTGDSPGGELPNQNAAPQTGSEPARQTNLEARDMTAGILNTGSQNFNAPVNIHINTPPAAETPEPRPLWMWVLLVCLLIAIGAAGLLFFIPLFQAGEAVWAGVGALIGITGAGYAIWQFAFKQLPAVRHKRLRTWQPIIVLVLVLIGLLLLRFPVHYQLGQQQYTAAMRADSPEAARTHVESAKALGYNVAENLPVDLLEALHDANSSDEAVRMVAYLTEKYGAVSADLLAGIRVDVDKHLRSGNQKLLERAARVLATLSLEEAGKLAEEFNDAGVRLLENPEPNDVGVAERYLETVIILQNEYPVERPPEAKSTTLYNVGYARELSGNQDGALEAYREAVEIYPDNFDAVYAYSSLLLIRQATAASPDTDMLNAAEDMTRQAVERDGCRQPIPADHLTKQDMCFRLWTTLAGIDLLLEADTGDIRPAVDRAIRLAEQSNQFAQFPYQVWTAEAYYYDLKLSEKEDTTPLLKNLCNIRLHHNPASERHQDWAKAAAQALKTFYPEAECD